MCLGVRNISHQVLDVFVVPVGVEGGSERSDVGENKHRSHTFQRKTSTEFADIRASMCIVQNAPDGVVRGANDPREDIPLANTDQE
jgi:hypothetical protein